MGTRIRGFTYNTFTKNKRRQKVLCIWQLEGVAANLVEAAMTSLQRIGINKVALVVFERNETGNEFWEKMGFTVRNDLVYRNKALVEIVRMDT